MSASEEAVVVLVTGPDREALTLLGRALVEERLIACLNVVEGVTSIYRWEGAVEEQREALGVAKTTAARAPQVCRRVLELHPYAVPEVLVLPVSAGSDAYLSWVREAVG